MSLKRKEKGVWHGGRERLEVARGLARGKSWPRWPCQRGRRARHKSQSTEKLYRPEAISYIAAPFSQRRYFTPRAWSAGLSPSVTFAPALAGTYTTAVVFAGIATLRVSFPFAMVQWLSILP